MFRPLHWKRLVISLIVFVAGLTSLFISRGEHGYSFQLSSKPFK